MEGLYAKALKAFYEAYYFHILSPLDIRVGGCQETQMVQVGGGSITQVTGRTEFFAGSTGYAAAEWARPSPRHRSVSSGNIARTLIWGLYTRAFRIL